MPPTENRVAGEKPPIHCEEACSDPSRADVLWKGASIDEPVTGPSVSPVIAGPSCSDVSSDMPISTVGVQNDNRRASVRRAAKAKWIGGRRRAWACRCTRWRPKRRRRRATASVRRRARRARRQALCQRDRQAVGQSSPDAFENPACLQPPGTAHVGRCAPLREFPPPPSTGITDQEELRVQLKAVFEASPQRAVLATDGSSRDEIGAFSIVSESPPWSFVGADEGEDQTPFRMELLALVELLTAAATLPCLPEAIIILVDCEAALKALVSPGACCLRLLAYEAFLAVKLIRMRATQIHFIWVPSHGKKSRWTPPLHLDATTCRRQNEQADLASRRHCADRCTGADRQLWHAEHIAASTHEVTLVRFSSRAGTLLEDHMKCTARAAAAAE